MHQNLGDLGPVRLVRLADRMQLRRTDDALGATRDEQQDGPGLDLLGDALPEALEIGRCVEVHEADRGAVRHGVAQYLGQRRNRGSGARPVQPLDRDFSVFLHFSSALRTRSASRPSSKIYSIMMDEHGEMPARRPEADQVSTRTLRCSAIPVLSRPSQSGAYRKVTPRRFAGGEDAGDGADAGRRR